MSGGSIAAAWRPLSVSSVLLLGLTAVIACVIGMYLPANHPAPSGPAAAPITATGSAISSDLRQSVASAQPTLQAEAGFEQFAAPTNFMGPCGEGKGLAAMCLPAASFLGVGVPPGLEALAPGSGTLLRPPLALPPSVTVTPPPHSPVQLSISRT